MPSLKTLLAAKTNDQLLYYLSYPEKHTADAVEVALAELRCRNVTLENNIEEVIAEKQSKALAAGKKKKHLHFLTYTIFFCLVMAVFSALAIIVISLAHLFFTKAILLGCTTAWQLLWILSLLIAIALPPVMYFYLKNLNAGKKSFLPFVFLAFNLLEYGFLASAIQIASLTFADNCSETMAFSEYSIYCLITYPVLIVIALCFDASEANTKLLPAENTSRAFGDDKT